MRCCFITTNDLIVLRCNIAVIRFALCCSSAAVLQSTTALLPTIHEQ